MSQNGFSVDVEILENEVRAMNDAVEQAEKELAALLERVEALNSSWSGPANLTFRETFRQDHEASEEGCKELRRQIQRIEDAGKKYRACETSVLQKVQSL